MVWTAGNKLTDTVQISTDKYFLLCENSKFS